MRAILTGILASFFFAFTFVLNRAMNLLGGSWIWSASLRYLFMLPLLFVLLLMTKRSVAIVFAEMRRQPGRWLLWSTVGFGLFYAPLCFAGDFGPSWLVAGTFQVTIVAGSLLVPFFSTVVDTPNGSQKVRQSIPFKGLIFSLLILVGIAVMQAQEATAISPRAMVLGIVPVLVSAVSYPLGNRKMMQVVSGRLDAFQRTFGMTVASLPFWAVLSVYGLCKYGYPSAAQTGQSLLVAISSGVIATLLFFSATDRVKGSMQMLAAVEATQAGEVVFTVLGEIFLLAGRVPSVGSFVGIGIVIVGMVLHSLIGSRPQKSTKPQGRENSGNENPVNENSINDKSVSL